MKVGTIFLLRLSLTAFAWITPVIVYGATYYVAKTGSNISTCTQAQSSSTPKLTINAGLGCLQSSDTLIIKAGTYDESIEFRTIPSGTANTQTVIKAAPGEAVVIKPSVGNSLGDAVTIYDRSYITLDGLTIDGKRFRIGGRTSKGPYSHYITFQNGIIRNSVNANYREFTQSCTATQGPAGSNSHINYINNEIYNCGPTTAHGLYLHARDSLIERNRIHHVSGTGIHLYHKYDPKVANNNIIRYNEIYSNGTVGILSNVGSNHLIHGNIIRGNGHDGILLYGLSNNHIYNNKISDNKRECVWLRTSASNTTLTNNACWQNAQNRILDEATNTSLSNNLFSAPSSTPVRSIPSAPLNLRLTPLP